MKQFSCWILIAFISLGVSYADEDVEKANAYIDKFIEKATNETGGFIDPLPLDELGRSFEREIGFVRVKGEARLYDGTIHGLSTLERKGDAKVIDLDDILIVSCQLTFKKVHAFYRGSILLNDKGPKITVNAKIGSSKVSMFFTVPTEGGKADLMSFNINKLQDIRISIWGLGAMGWTASIISTLALNALEKPVAKTASLKIFEYFSKEIEKVPYPGDGVTGGTEATATAEVTEVTEVVTGQTAETEVTETTEEVTDLTTETGVTGTTDEVTDLTTETGSTGTTDEVTDLTTEEVTDLSTETTEVTEATEVVTGLTAATEI